MPAPLILALSKRYKVSRATVEGYWNECKAAIHPTEGGKDGYGIVTNCVKAKLRKLKQKK